MKKSHQLMNFNNIFGGLICILFSSADHLLILVHFISHELTPFVPLRGLAPLKIPHVRQASSHLNPGPHLFITSPSEPFTTRPSLSTL